jgi:hypothetical protein
MPFSTSEATFSERKALGCPHGAINPGGSINPAHPCPDSEQAGVPFRENSFTLLLRPEPEVSNVIWIPGCTGA